MKFFLIYSNGQWNQSMIQPLGKMAQNVHCKYHIVEHCPLICSHSQPGVFLFVCHSLITASPALHTYDRGLDTERKKGGSWDPVFKAPNFAW